jgi:hypothetical protein
MSAAGRRDIAALKPPWLEGCPDGVRAQIDGSALWGMSFALTAEAVKKAMSV